MSASFSSVLAVLAVAIAVLANPGISGAQERIALVIGNGTYDRIASLPNPTSDAELMSETLADAGFRVIKITDAGLDEMKRGISEFGRALIEAGPETTALFYYAGHAVQSFGNNYLLPTDSNIRHQGDLDLYGVEANWMLRQLYAARVKTSIVILDSCRNNPFAAISGFDEEGLAEMNAPTGTFIAYATAPGDVALDGTGDNSPYTLALADAIATQSSPVEQLFKSVRIRVLNETGGRQTPWDSSSLTSDFRFHAVDNPGAASAGSAPAQPADLVLWNSIRDSESPDQIRLFLRAYPNSAVAPEAQEQLALLEGERGLRLADDPSNESGGDQTMTFETPISDGTPEIIGLTIQQVFNSVSPQFPPIEGLPEELWKNQKCSNCHQWNRERLCEQGRFYVDRPDYDPMNKKHPLGGTFKVNIREWARAGCW